MTLDIDAQGLVVPKVRPSIPGGGPQSVAQILDQALANDPDKTAIVGRRGRLSFRTLDLEVNRAAHALLGLGVRPQDRIAASLPNDVEIVVAFLASMRIGAIWLGINRNLAGREKVYMLADSGAAWFLGDPESVDQIERFPAETPELRRAIRVDTSGLGSEWTRITSSAGDDGRPLAAIDPHAPAAIAYTSGTTGFPKGVVHSHHNMLLPGAVLASHGRAYSSAMVNGVILPLTILNPLILQPLVTFRVGGTVVLFDRIDPDTLLRSIRDERVTVFMTVPTIMQDLLAHPGLTSDDLASVVVAGVGGTHTPEPLRDMYRQWFGTEITSGYGLTEAPTAVTGQNPSKVVAGGSGTALPQVEITIVDEMTDEPLPHGVVGEITVGPRNTGPWAGAYTPMLGYWRRPEETTRALRGGRLHTGDVGSLDERGNLFVKDRRSDLILRGGANVYPAEVERVLEASIPGSLPPRWLVAPTTASARTWWLSYSFARGPRQPATRSANGVESIWLDTRSRPR